MKDFMFLFRSAKGETDKLSEEERKNYLNKWGAWFTKLSDDGRLKEGERLSHKEAKTISTADKVIIDGPYTESKEIIGGYAVIQAESIDEAAEIAKECPIFLLGGSLEIRTSFA
jgi:hypothetical protein